MRKKQLISVVLTIVMMFVCGNSLAAKSSGYKTFKGEISLIAGLYMFRGGRRKAAEKRFEELKKGVKEEQSKTVGMTDATRKRIFWDLVELQDSLMKKYPYDNQKQQEAYKIIAKKYDVLEFVVRQIAVRGAKEGWPQPPLR